MDPELTKVQRLLNGSKAQPDQMSETVYPDRIRIQFGIGMLVCIVALLFCSLGLFLRDTNGSPYWPVVVGLFLAYWLIGSSLSLKSLVRSNWKKTGLFPIISAILLAILLVTKLAFTGDSHHDTYVLVDFVFNLIGGGLSLYIIAVFLLTSKYRKFQ